MYKPLLGTALLASLAFSPASQAEDSASTHTLSANVGLVSDYAFRGVSQTDENPALQGGFDYSHASGLYAGVWGSSVSWLSDSDSRISNSLELDAWGGYRGSIGAIGYDVGLLQYHYPGSYPRGFNKADTLEAYVGLSWEFLSFKYSHALTDLFGYDDSEDSAYYEVGSSFELGDGFTLGAHYGYSDIRGQDNYSDWKVGVSKALGGFTLGLHYVDTDIRNSKLADERLIVSISRSF